MALVPTTLITTRFIMTLRTLNDLSELLDLDDDPDVIAYVGSTDPRDQREAYWRQAVTTNDQSPVMVIRDRATQEFMGWAFLRPFKDDSGDWELGYRLKKAAWGQGIGTEACRALMAWGWAQPVIHTIGAGYEAANTASLNIMLKLGMRPMGLRHYEDDGDFPYCAISRPV